MNREDLQYLINKKNTEGRNFPKKRHKQEEKGFQIAYIEWLRFHHPTIITLMSPITKLTGNKWSRIKQGHTLKKMGYMPGTHDLTLMVARGGYHGLVLELKTSKGRVSDDQSAIGIALAMEGYRVEICYSFDEALETTKHYLNLK